MSTTPKKLKPEQFARKYVNMKLAEQLPKSAIQNALTAAILYKGVLVELREYAAAQDEVIIRADDCEAILPEGVWAALSPERRKRLRNLINKEVDAHRKGLKAAIRFVQEQADAIGRGSDAFKEAFERNENDYLNAEIQ